MKTLIELYDERPLENVLAVEALKPKHVIYICADAATADGLNERFNCLVLTDNLAHQVVFHTHQADTFGLSHFLDGDT